MAYREPETLTCPSCAKLGEMAWVIGEGPNTKPGEGPAYVDVLDAGNWIVKTRATFKKWSGEITCPDCKATVLQRD